jgi:hypothetical protein
MKATRWLAAALIGMAPTDRAMAQTPNAAVLTIDGEVSRTFTLAELRALPRVSVTAAEHDAAPARYEGVALAKVLEVAGLAMGTALRGPRLATYLLLTASDGYRVVFALPELDSAFTDRQVVIADRREGADLDARHGPLRVVAAGEKRPARWIRQLVRISVRRAAE